MPAVAMGESTLVRHQKERCRIQNLLTPRHRSVVHACNRLCKMRHFQERKKPSLTFFQLPQHCRRIVQFAGKRTELEQRSNLNIFQRPFEGKRSRVEKDDVGYTQTVY